jgi:hypothetical protein
MRLRKLSIAAVFILLLSVADVAEPAGRVPVLVELFTSEGCSSCPPADQLLAQLAAQKPLPEVEIITMSEHVDYWNSQGWSDPFSSAQFSRRQEEYTRALGDGPYTPQMVVDGTTEFVGSNRGAALQALLRAGQKPKAVITIAKAGDEGTDTKLQIRMGPATGLDWRGPFDVYLAVTEDNLSSNVVRGENRGRKLSHASVVRKLNLIGQGDDVAGFTATPIVQIDRHWKPVDVRVIVFAQSRKTRAILAVSTLPLVTGAPAN